ncbi:hypothetical protein AYR66_18000 [Noviherbaspirillum denitrificans]|uniref:Uncharacterized protein n=1 Tax=Noviherbaspirillum denitrificans TaxID=1968433 RepID=A0A254TFZ2_9BURK|nr:hypothetical protein AYR66_18000 [Noviherbaspirillum denitrificans]
MTTGASAIALPSPPRTSQPAAVRSSDIASETKRRCKRSPHASSIAAHRLDGVTQPPRGNNHAPCVPALPVIASTATPSSQRTKSGGRPSASTVSRCICACAASLARCSTPHASPANARPIPPSASQRPTEYRKAVRSSRDEMLSSLDSRGIAMPARLPDASCAGRSWRSTSVTCQPRAANRSLAAHPAMPAPITIASRTAGSGRTCGCQRGA